MITVDDLIEKNKSSVIEKVLLREGLKALLVRTCFLENEVDYQVISNKGIDTFNNMEDALDKYNNVEAGEISLEERKTDEAENGFIIIAKTFELPPYSLCDKVTANIDADIMIAQAYGDNSSSIIENLSKIGAIDDYNEEQKELHIQLATDLLTQNTEIKFIEE